MRNIGVFVRLDVPRNDMVWARIFHGWPTSEGAVVHSWEVHETSLGRAITHCSLDQNEEGILKLIVQLDDESPLLRERWQDTGELLLERRMKQLFSGAAEVRILEPAEFGFTPLAIESRRKPAGVIGRITPRVPAESEVVIHAAAM